ncbi:MAG: helix-turn-helix domain-containing protein [Planctomycetota bacterium]
MTLSKKLAAAIKAKKLNATTAAKAIGVSYPTVKAILDGKSYPNARSLTKFATFLGEDLAAFTTAVEAEKTKTGKRAGRPAKTPGAKKATAKPAAKKATAKPAAKKATAKPAAKKAAAKPAAKSKASSQEGHRQASSQESCRKATGQESCRKASSQEGCRKGTSGQAGTGRHRQARPAQPARQPQAGRRAQGLDRICPGQARSLIRPDLNMLCNGAPTLGAPLHISSQANHPRP